MIWWILGGIVAVVVFGYLLTVVVGAVVPLEVSGRKYLRQQIKKQGVNDWLITEQCLKDLVDQQIIVARMLSAAGGQKSLQEVFTDQLDSTAVLVATHMDGGFGNSPAQNNPIYHTLVKHKVVD